jgi:hypothetical protein
MVEVEPFSVGRCGIPGGRVQTEKPQPSEPLGEATQLRGQKLQARTSGKRVGRGLP